MANPWCCLVWRRGVSLRAFLSGVLVLPCCDPDLDSQWAISVVPPCGTLENREGCFGRRTANAKRNPSDMASAPAESALACQTIPRLSDMLAASAQVTAGCQQKCKLGLINLLEWRRRICCFPQAQTSAICPHVRAVQRLPQPFDTAAQNAGVLGCVAHSLR
jgi:hypothetical protein